MSIADVIGAIALLNQIVINGKQLAVNMTLDGEDITADELIAHVNANIDKMEALKTNDDVKE